LERAKDQFQDASSMLQALEPLHAKNRELADRWKKRFALLKSVLGPSQNHEPVLG